MKGRPRRAGGALVMAILVGRNDDLPSGQLLTNAARGKPSCPLRVVNLQAAHDRIESDDYSWRDH